MVLLRYSTSRISCEMVRSRLEYTTTIISDSCDRYWRFLMVLLRYSTSRISCEMVRSRLEYTTPEIPNGVIEVQYQ